MSRMFALVSLAVLVAASPAVPAQQAVAPADTPESICAADAKDAGITAPAELEAYMAECLKDFSPAPAEGGNSN